MVVYLDIIWMLNILIDSFLIWATAILLKKRVRPVRIILSGFLGSLIIIATITPFSNIAGHPLSKLCISILMILLAFGFKTISQFLTTLCTFYFITFLMGGILLGTHYFVSYNASFDHQVILHKVQRFGDPISWIFLLFVFPLAWHFSRRRIEGITVSNIQYDMLYNVTIKINDITIKLPGLVDSGNQLLDPLTKMPVMVVSVETIRDLLPQEVLALTNEDQDILESCSVLKNEWSTIMRLIPAKSLGKNNQLYCAFKPDYLLIEDDKGKQYEEKALVVFTGQTLAKDHAFQCIIHPQTVSGKAIRTAS